MALSLVILLVQAVVYVQSQNPVIPSHFNYSTLVVQAANGSSVTGHCSDTTQHLDAWSTCSSPASSVLFDGVIPTLTALDGDTWASQLMILQRPLIGSYSFSVYSSFANASWIRRVEVVMLNCPQWGTAVDSIRIEFQYPGSRSYRNSRNGFPSVISCDSLVKVCIPVDIHDSALTGIKLDFYTWDNDRDQFYKVHLAEVSFYEDASPCPPFTIIPGNLTPPQENEGFGTTIEQTDITTEQTDIVTEQTDIITEQTYISTEQTDIVDIVDITTEKTDITTEQTSSDTLGEGVMREESNCNCGIDKSFILSVLAMIIALQTTVIFLVVLVVLCKCRRPGATPKHIDITKSVQFDNQVFEMDPGERSVSQKSP